MSIQSDWRPEPVVFLNPALVAAPVRAVHVGQTPPVGAVGNLDFRNEAVDALNRICERMGAAIVCTAPAGAVDPRDQLLAEGVRARFAIDWQTDWGKADRSAAIALWHLEHHRPAAILIDRPGITLQGAVVISIAETVGLTVAVAEQALTLAMSRQEPGRG